MADYDLTYKIAKYLDRHMIFPLLEFLSSHKIYDEKEILEMKVDLLKNTNMVDFAMECYRNLHPDESVPEGLLLCIYF
jgi:translation initiation factor 3 subunit E